MLVSLGVFLLGMFILLFILNMVSFWIKGKKVFVNFWWVIGLEWMIFFLLDVENFEEFFIIIFEFYGYGKLEFLIVNNFNGYI